MTVKFGGMSQSLNSTGRSIANMLVGVILVSMLVFLLVRIVIQFATPSLPPRLLVVKDIPLPGAMPDTYRTEQNPVAPGLALLFDHFDFQVLDSQTHLLFIAHTGPSPDVEQQVNPKFNPYTDAKSDGNVVVFNIQLQRVVALLPIPQVAGITLASDLHKVYAADTNDNIVYVIDEQTLKFSPIELATNDSPDSMTYDPIDHLIFVSVPGAPANPDKSNVVDRKNQNENVIDARTDKVVARIPLGVDGQWGDDVGHVKFDPGLHRIFVVVQQLADPDSPNPNLLPPPDTARLVAINPVTKRVIKRMLLPSSCITPHGMAIDTEQHIALIACIDASPPSLYRVDLLTMQALPEAPWPLTIKPDVIALDHPLHLVFVACGAGLVIFKEAGRAFQWIGTYTFGVNTHSIAIDEQTHQLYIPIARLGGRPVLRILQYNSDGAV